MHPPRLSRLAACSAVLLLSAGLAACGTGDETGGEGATPPPVTPTVSPVEPATTTEETTVTTATTTTTREVDEGLSPEVERTYETFGALAPESLFEQFESCNPGGIDDSHECSGPEVGQFQFFESMSKAASTTQLLTELRSSRVVEDTVSRVVGWSTLGTTAVITVVDNDRGLVMQQMVSSDRVDPEERIYELGLVARPAGETPETETESPTREPRERSS